MSSLPTPYTIFKLPTGKALWIPEDIQLRLPDKASIAPDLLHYLVYIPWDARLIEQIDPAYRDFFRAVLPYLHARSTDVHVATCLPFMKELIRAGHESVDELVVHLAFILHDSGWSQMTEQEIADSLDVAGLALSATATGPKLRHAELGKELAQRILGEYAFQPPLTTPQKESVYQAILYHDRPQELATMGGIPVSLQVVCDTDHLWSFTHQDFWQDTVRKGIDPRIYLKNLGKDLDGYFVAEPARRKARQMLEARAVEVKAWEDWVEQH